MRIRATLQRNLPGNSFINGTFSTEISDYELSSITSNLLDNLLRTIHNCTTAKAAWDKLQAMHVNKTLINQLGLLNSLLNMKLKSRITDGRSISKIRTQFSIPAATNYLVNKSIPVAVLGFIVVSPCKVHDDYNVY